MSNVLQGTPSPRLTPNPKPQIHPKPQTRNLKTKPQTPHPEPQTTIHNPQTTNPNLGRFSKRAWRPRPAAYQVRLHENVPTIGVQEVKKPPKVKQGSPLFPKGQPPAQPACRAPDPCHSCRKVMDPHSGARWFLWGRNPGCRAWKPKRAAYQVPCHSEPARRVCLCSSSREAVTVFLSRKSSKLPNLNSQLVL